jgi:hypothetical protein
VFETRHLRYSDFSGMVSLRSHDDGPDIPVGYVEDACLCPEPYAAEWEWLRQEVRDAVRFALGCRAAADGAWRDRFDARGW